MSRRSAAGLAGIAVVAATAWGIAGERSALALDAAGSAFQVGDWAGAEGLAAEAVALDPSIPPNNLVVALAAAREGDEAAALEALRTVVEADDLPAAWIDIAWLEASAGDDEAARDALVRGLRLGEQQPALVLAAGYVHESLGDTTDADRLYAQVLRALPRVAADPFWSDPVRVARWPAIESTVIATLGHAGLVELYLTVDDVDRARAAATEAADATLVAVVEAWAGDPRARADLDARARAEPHDVFLLAWNARIATRYGDAPAAVAYRYWANAITPEADRAALEVSITFDAGPMRNVAGATWAPYGVYTYRRPTPVDLLVPELPLLTWIDPE